MLKFYSALSVVVSFLIFAQVSAVPPDQRALQLAVDRMARKPADAVILIDPVSGNQFASLNAEVFHKPYPPGSLIKVFTLIAYLRDHGHSFPVFYCPATLSGKRDGCWYRNGHGLLTHGQALAQSCNVYFRQLSDQVSTSTFAQTLNQFGFPFDRYSFTDAEAKQLMIGSNHHWAVPPIMMLRAYCSFFNHGYLWPILHNKSGYVFTSPAALTSIRNGMKLGAMEGTSVLAHRITNVALFGKTGTTLKWVEGRTDWRKTQGWWIGFYPADGDPEIAVMAFTPGGRGAADAARLGGTAIRAYMSAPK